MGYNRTRPLPLRYKIHDYGGLRLKHCEVETLIRKLKAIQNLIVKLDSSKLIIFINNWYQHVSDPTFPILEKPSYLTTYVNSVWMTNFVLLLSKYNIQIKISNIFLQKKQRFNDSCLMHIILQSNRSTNG